MGFPDSSEWTALGAVVGALVSSLVGPRGFLWSIRSNRREDRSVEGESLVRLSESYAQIVNDLRLQVDRLQVSMVEYREENESLRRQVELLRTENESLLYAIRELERRIDA